MDDVRYALRGFRRSPGFTLAAVVSLALGIGANTAIFSLANAVLLRKLPVREPDRLVVFGLNAAGASPISQALFLQVRERNTVLEEFAGVTFPPITIAGDGSAERLNGLLVSGSFFETLGVRALIGRVLTPDDDRIPDSPSVCVLGYGLWQRRFAKDPGVIGRKIQINGTTFTVIGVTPKEFVGISQTSQVDIAIPVRAIGMRAFDSFPLLTIGRLKSGVSLAQAQASLDVLYHQLASPSEVHVVLKSGSQGFSRLRGQYESSLLLLMGVVGALLLIACANIASLLLARASGRAKEIAVRLALGAKRSHLVRQLLTECTLLTMAGALAGMALAYGMDHALLALSPRQFGGGAAIVDVNPDARVLLFTVGVAILVSFLSGIGPAVQSTRPGLAPALKGTAGVRAPGRFSFTSAMVVAQVALSLVLTIGAGLFLRSLHNIKSVDPGLDPDRLVVLTIDPGSAGYSLAASHGFFDSLVERARRLPGVIAASPGFVSPLSGGFAIADIRVPGSRRAPDESNSIAVNWIGTDYFKTLGTPLVAGRVFTEQDGRANQVAIVNQKTAARFWPHENPLGKRFTLTDRNHSEELEIVGLVKDVKSESLREAAQPAVYVPFRTNPRAHVTLHVRVAGETGPVIQALLGAIHELDPNLPAVDVTTMAAQLDRTILLDRLIATLTTLFGFVAIVLAAVGLYGVMAFTVAARTREIGIRMALGAGRARVLRQVIGESAALTLAGIAVGIPGALWASRAAASFLYGLSPTDPMIYVALSIALATVAMGAAWIPARRAARIDPMTALRYD